MVILCLVGCEGGEFGVGVLVYSGCLVFVSTVMVVWRRLSRRQQATALHAAVRAPTQIGLFEAFAEIERCVE